MSVDAIGAGERATLPGEFEYHGQHQATSLFSAGETLLGTQLYDNMRGIDLLQSLDDVDGSRIGATGASGGGNQTLWVSALDERIKASVPVVSIGTMESYVTNYNCWCETLPGALKLTATWELLGLIAPNPLLILTAAKEKNAAFLPQEMFRSHAAAKKVYGLYDAEDKISCQVIDGPHSYLPEMQSHMLGWFKYWLAGDGSPLPRVLPKVAAIPESELMCFPGKSRPREVLSLLSYSARKTQECQKALAAQPRLNREKKLRELRGFLKLPSALALRRCSAASHEENDGFLIERFSIETEPDILIPCVLVSPIGKKLSSLTLAVHGDSKDACLREPSVQALLRAGHAVCLADLRHTGETKWDYIEFTDHLHITRTVFLLGHTVIGQWVNDLLSIRAALAKRGGKIRIGLMAFEEAAIAALAAAALDRQFSSVHVERLLATYVIKESPLTQRYSLYLPGILKWGDISQLAALVACPLEVRSLVNASGKALSPKQCRDWMNEASVEPFS